MNIKKSKQVYLDNAATTQLDPKVLEAMLPYMQEQYGNPSSTHSLGNRAKTAIEDVRRAIMDRLGTSKGNIFFTSSGTEANNWAIAGTVERHAIQHVITSPIEHESVLQCIKRLVHTRNTTCSYVDLDKLGQIKYDSLITLLEKYPKALVSLMHANNEIGNLTDLYHIGSICKKYRAIFHTDTVQTLGNYLLDLKNLPIDICTGSAHKLHGPKGVGFIYVNNNVQLNALLYGGMQERGLRAGTENVAGIVGLGKALEIAMENRSEHFSYLQNLKSYMIKKLQKAIPSIKFHGLCNHSSKSLCNLLNIGLPLQGLDSETLMFKLTIQGISASKGSACMSGTSTRSHVLDAINIPQESAVIRFSFSKYTTHHDIDYTVKRLSTILNKRSKAF